MEKISAGIDLGTTNSCLAVLQDGRPVVIRNEFDEPTTPSVVSIQADGTVVGKTARKLLLTQPTSTFASIKRKMGQRYSRSVLGKEYTPESISAIILRHLKQYGERRLSSSIDEVVITVPAHFNSSQRQATRDAGEIAGLKVLRVINEPTAAALAYAHMHQLSSVLLVFDLGGGTFDISVVEAGDGVYEVLHSAGDNHLGGDDFNLRIVRWIVEEFRKQSGIDIRRDASALALVHERAITAKHALTDAKEVTLLIENLASGHTFQAVLTRGAFEAMGRDLFDRLRTIAGNVVAHLNQYRYRDAYPGVFSNRLEGCDILLVGGETRVPAVRQLVWECFNGKVRDDVNPDEVVAMGAALQAGIIQRRGDIGQVVLVDTTALSLGTAVQGGIFSRIIDANTKIPCSRTQQYVPLADYIPFVQFGVYQGESDLCANNVKLGEFQFPIQPPRPREQVVFALTYALDADDILHVTAVETGTGAKQEMSIRDSQNLDRETISRLHREAEESRGADQIEVQRLQRRQWLYEFLREVTRHIPALTARDPRSLVLAEVVEQAEAVRIALDRDDEVALEQAATNLEDAWHRLGMALPPRTGPALERPPAESALPPMTQGPSGADMVACGHCGASLPPGFAFCGKCGMPLKKENCSKCGAALVEGFAFCGKCGAKVD